MITVKRTTSDDKDFGELVKLLDAFLAEIDGDEHAFYAQLNKTSLLKHAVVAYEDGVAVGCGAIKAFDDTAMEVKRMYTLPQHRGKGIARMVLSELEKWTAELAYPYCVLETGKQQVEAIALYTKQGYVIIPSYGQYVNVANSICFQKKLN